MFNNPTLRRLWLKIRYPVGIILFLATPQFMQAHLVLPAFIVALIGSLIQVWSFASLVKNEELTIRGPYVLVRNPMYLGRYLMGLGFIILFGLPWLAVVYTVLYYLYMVNRVKREEKLLAELLPGHAEYCSKVNRFIPTLGVSSEHPVLYFSWAQLRINHGVRSFIIFLSVSAALAVYLLFF
jgi:protein-S-isoprenylcysteine O-methyltransferase Ste14